MNQFKLSLIIALSAILFISCEGKSQANNNEKTKQEITKSNILKKTYILKEFKQSCCSGIVEYSLKEVSGFIKSEANVKKQELTVWFDSAKSTEENIKKAINKTSYKIVE